MTFITAVVTMSFFLWGEIMTSTFAKQNLPFHPREYSPRTNQQILVLFNAVSRKAKDKLGKWVRSGSRPSLIPFTQSYGQD